MTVKIIDGHRHITCPEAIRIASQLDPKKSSDFYPPGVHEASAIINRKLAPEWSRKMSDLEENIADLLAAGMDMGILQPNPLNFCHWADPGAGAELARMVNEYTARGVRQHPDRLLGLATVPLQDTGLAIKELAYAVRELGLRGVVIPSNVNGHGLDEEQFLSFFRETEQLDVPIFIHPHYPAGAERIGNYYLINFIGYPMESTVTAAQLAFGGVFDRCPNLKICLMHAGGALPFLLGRLEHGQSVRPEAQEHCKHPFAHYLKNFYVDTITFRPETLRFVVEIMPEGHVFVGTDYPYDMADMDPVSSVRSAVTDEVALDQIFCKSLSRVIGLS